MAKCRLADGVSGKVTTVWTRTGQVLDFEAGKVYEVPDMWAETLGKNSPLYEILPPDTPVSGLYEIPDEESPDIEDEDPFEDEPTRSSYEDDEDEEEEDPDQDDEAFYNEDQVL